MTTRQAMAIIGVGVGVPSIVWFGYETSWQAAVALFLAMFANNASQYRE